MSLYVLDTDTLTLWLSGHPHVVSRVASTEDDRLSVSVVTVEECLSGWYAQIRKSARDDIRLARAYRSLQDTVEVLGQMRILPFDAPAHAHKLDSVNSVAQCEGSRAPTSAYALCYYY